VSHEMPAPDVRAFIALGLAALINEIPILIRDARLQLGKNDIGLVINVDPDGRRYFSQAKPREPLGAELFMQVTLKTLKVFQTKPPPGEVPTMVFFKNHVFAFLYVLQNTEAVLN
jgi:hypothetical protein